MTFIKELRDAAAACTNPVYKHELRRAADDLLAWTDYLFHYPSREAMKSLNGSWANAERILKGVPAEADPNPPLAGAPEAARLAA